MSSSTLYNKLVAVEALRWLPHVSANDRGRETERHLYLYYYCYRFHTSYLPVCFIGTNMKVDVIHVNSQTKASAVQLRTIGKQTSRTYGRVVRGSGSGTHTQVSNAGRRLESELTIQQSRLKIQEQRRRQSGGDHQRGGDTQYYTDGRGGAVGAPS